MPQQGTQFEKYLQNGCEIFRTYCPPDALGFKNVFMFPRAPQQKYIDLYPDDDQLGSSSQIKDDKTQQQNYEAEVIVYRALERLEEIVIVLHSLEYSHFQYHLGDASHVKQKCGICKKKAANREGECDFLVIGANYFIIIEVKNMCHIGEKSAPKDMNDQKFRALAGTFEKSLKQRKKVADMIKRFSGRLTILQFTAYPNFSKNHHDEFLLNKEQKSTIIFKEDLNCFDNWWNENVKDFILDEPLNCEMRKNHDKVRDLLLAVWCTDSKGRCNMSKYSLGKCIVDIDKDLNCGRFTLRGNNPEVISTPQLVRDFLGVDNLSKEQFDALNSAENFLFINGPAGAGKTVVLVAKILQLVMSSEHNKVVLFIPTMDANNLTTEAVEKYQGILNKAGVKQDHVTFEDTTNTVDEIYHEISNCLLASQVVIVVTRGYNVNHNPEYACDFDETYSWLMKQRSSIWMQDLLGSLTGINLFIDDAQLLIGCGGLFSESYDFIKTLLKLSTTHFVWLACDVIQSVNFCDKTWDHKLSVNFPAFLERTVSPEQIVSLSKNLRNTSDIASALSTIRNRAIELKCHVKSEIVDAVFPLQRPGHYIHGPKTIIHTLQNFERTLIETIFTHELDNLCRDGFINKSEVGFIFGGEDVDTLSLVDRLQCSLPENKYMWTCMLASSGEWPAVIVLLPLVDRILEEKCRLLFESEGNWEIKSQDQGPERFERLQLADRQSSSDVENLYLAMSRARVKCTVIMYPLEGMIFDDFVIMKELLSDKYNLDDLVEVRQYPLLPPTYVPRSFSGPKAVDDYLKEKFTDTIVFPDSL